MVSQKILVSQQYWCRKLLRCRELLLYHDLFWRRVQFGIVCLVFANDIGITKDVGFLNFSGVAADFGLANFRFVNDSNVATFGVANGSGVANFVGFMTLILGWFHDLYRDLLFWYPGKYHDLLL